MIAGIVPANRLRDAKTRLRVAVPGINKQDLVLWMLEEVLGSMVNSKLDAIYFVSSDEILLERSRTLGAKSLKEPGSLGANGAVELANEQALRDGADATLVIFSDIPLITGEDVNAYIRKGLEVRECVVASRSIRGGTNALWRRPPDVIPSRYGENSFINHRLEAKKAGVPFFEFHSERISLDVDTHEDLTQLLKKVRSSNHPFLSRLMRKG